MGTWNRPAMTEIKMDAEISSYQDDANDPMKDGPRFAKSEHATEGDRDALLARS